MISLLRKELRGLLPLFVLTVVLCAVDLVFVPLTERLDEVSWAGSFGDLAPGEGGGSAMLLLILALVVAFSLFPREHEEGTIAFLYSLPVTRGQVFAAKLVAAYLVLLAGVAAWQLCYLLLQLPNPQSFTGEQLGADVFLGVSLLYALYAGIVLSHGVLLSFLRKFGLLIYALLAWALLFLEEKSSAVSWLNVTHLLELEYAGTQLVIPWEELGLHLGIAGVCLLLAAFLWTGAGERFSALYARVHEDALGRVGCGCCGSVLLVLVVGALFMFLMDASVEDEPVDGVEYLSFATGDAETTHYRFTYPLSHQARARRLIRQADAAYQAVRGALAAEDAGRIVADLTEVSTEHAGIAGWQKIRVGLVGQDDEQRLLRTFHHETVHAFEFSESQRRMGENADATQFFSEGLAEYLAFELVPEARTRRASRRLALAAWKRQRIRFEDMCSYARLRGRHDPHLSYSLGETWCAALVRTCGAEAPGKVLRAMGREGAPRDLQPILFWQDTLQAAGYTLEEVVTAWESGLQELAREEAEFLAVLPRLGGGVAEGDADWVTLVGTLDRDPLPDCEYWLRVRDGPEAKDTELRHYEGEPTDDPRRVWFVVPRDELLGRRFQFQLGVVFDPTALPHFEPWQWGAVPR